MVMIRHGEGGLPALPDSSLLCYADRVLKPPFVVATSYYKK